MFANPSFSSGNRLSSPLTVLLPESLTPSNTPVKYCMTSGLVAGELRGVCTANAASKRLSHVAMQKILDDFEDILDKIVV